MPVLRTGPVCRAGLCIAGAREGWRIVVVLLGLYTVVFLLEQPQKRVVETSSMAARSAGIASEDERCWVMVFTFWFGV